MRKSKPPLRHSKTTIESSLEVGINRCLACAPLAHNVHVAKRPARCQRPSSQAEFGWEKYSHALAGNHTGNALLAITPPEEVGNTRPPSGISSSSSRSWLLRDHEAQAPALWWIACISSANTQTTQHLKNNVFSPSCGYNSGIGFVCSGFALGIP